MTKVVKYFLTTLIFIIIFTNTVKASEISIDDVITYMENNNILDDSDYFYMFGRMLNGRNNEYDINKFEYTITKDTNKINIKVTLTDKEQGEIEKTTILTIQDNIIIYQNNNNIESLESRIDTIIFNQLIYSIGGARSYNKNNIIDWMNQLDLNKITLEEGIECTTQNITYEIEQNNNTYEYEITVPVSYKIDINKLTNKVPEASKIEIKEVTAGVSNVTMKVFSSAYREKNCNIYRRNDSNEYVLVGTVSCNNGIFNDENLKDDTTYYYQASVENKVMCSDTAEVKTEKAPNTGTFLHIGIIIIVLGAVGGILYIVNKKNRFI